jgi:hypothetical protein
VKKRSEYQHIEGTLEKFDSASRPPHEFHGR